MRVHAADTTEEAVAALLTRVAQVVIAGQARAQLLDQGGIFPVEDLAALASAGALSAIAPTLMGGLGVGTEPAQAIATAQFLFAVGSGSVALGRIVEGHLNAVRLVMRYGDAAQRRAAATDVRAGYLHALWVTDGPDEVRYTRLGEIIELHGEKQFCSAAGHATRVVITALGSDGERRLLLLPLGRGETVHPLAASLQGVRSASTGWVCFEGVRHAAGVIFGVPGVYLREPEFSAGAWRASCVAAGALSALVDAARAELVARGRASNAEQRQRLGRMFAHAQTARLWVRHMAPFGEDADRAPQHAVATINLGRMAIEGACMETIQLVQRSLGLSAFLTTNPVERMSRDLATYLRQPAPDESLGEAAAYFSNEPEDALTL